MKQIRLGLLVALLAIASEGAELSPSTIYYGMCDASAAVGFGTNVFLVANDEDNVLRAYRRTPGALPFAVFDLTRFLQVKGKSPETDIEGAALVGDRIYWITSHGTNAKGKNSPDRHRFFATRVAVRGDQVQLKPEGLPYSRLLYDFAADGRLTRFKLVSGSRIAPKDFGGLNIEGLTTMPDGRLLLGFRNPIPGGKALLLPLNNAGGMIAGESARFGDPIQIDLGGLGVRSLGWANNGYIIIAGPSSSRGESKLFQWAGPGTEPKAVEGVSFAGLNPEGLAFELGEGRHDYFVLSDDGTLKIGGVDCKNLKDAAQRRFRGYTLRF